MNESISSKERIKKKREFSSLYRKGNRYRGKYFKFIYLTNELKHSRMAAVAGRKVGKAVTRNKAKRWIRDLFRRNKSLLKSPTDLIIMAKEGMLSAPWKQLEKDYIKAIKHINQKS
jgi:ribonuclease P protein component